MRRLPFARYPLIHQLPRPADVFWMTAPTESGGFDFLCDLRDVMSREVCFTGLFEPQETALLRRLLGPRIHKTLRTSPAQAAGLTERLWDMADVVRLVDQADTERRKRAS